MEGALCYVSSFFLWHIERNDDTMAYVFIESNQIKRCQRWNIHSNVIYILSRDFFFIFNLSIFTIFVGGATKSQQKTTLSNVICATIKHSKSAKKMKKYLVKRKTSISIAVFRIRIDSGYSHFKEFKTNSRCE